MFSRSYATSLGGRSFRVKGALAITGKLRKEIVNLKQQVNKLEEENRILRGIIAKNITPTTKKET